METERIEELKCDYCLKDDSVDEVRDVLELLDEVERLQAEEAGYLDMVKRAAGKNADLMKDKQELGKLYDMLKDEVERLKKENQELKTGTSRCAYCGERFPMDTVTADQVGSHIATCPKHPVCHLTQVSIKLASEVLSLTGMTGKIVAQSLVQQYLDERKEEG